MDNDKSNGEHDMDRTEVKAIVRNLNVKCDEDGIEVSVEQIWLGDEVHKGFSVRARTLDEVLIGFLVGWIRFCREHTDCYVDVEFINSIDG